MGTLALLLWGWAGLLVASGLALWALIKLPKPVPARWEVRLFLLMGMPADQYLSFIIKVRPCAEWVLEGRLYGLATTLTPSAITSTTNEPERRGPRVLAPRPVRGLPLAHERLLLGARGGAGRPYFGHRQGPCMHKHACVCVLYALNDPRPGPENLRR